MRVLNEVAEDIVGFVLECVEESTVARITLWIFVGVIFSIVVAMLLTVVIPVTLAFFIVLAKVFVPIGQAIFHLLIH